MKSPNEKYNKRIKKYKILHQKQLRLIGFIGYLRLLVFILSAVQTIILIRNREYGFAIGVVLLFLIVFIILVNWHRNIKDNSKLSEAIININGNSLKRFSGEWKEFKDTGEEFKNEDHSYSGDLDVFGRGSLFQYVNSCTTSDGRKKLAYMMTNTAHEAETIYEKQKALKELAEYIGWRQRFTAEGITASGEQRDTDSLLDWVNERNPLYSNILMKILMRALPALSGFLILFHYYIFRLPALPFIITLCIQGIMLFFNSSRRSRTLDTVYLYKDHVKLYSRMIAMIENKNFRSKYLIVLKTKFSNNGITASKQIRRLEKLSEAIANRRNAFFLIINILTLWDYQCLISLEKWKEASGKYLRGWVDGIAEYEALTSLAVIGFNHPDWTMPRFSDEETLYTAEEMGHPLLGEDRICNALTIRKPAGIILITGSNMSGKSTFLRTAGLNLVLSYIGTPVCAKSFTASLMKVCTCMRVSDNLEKNISSFYAELLRIKSILQAADRNGRIFFLLDEIFKGTNSLDRHTGAKILIKRLKKDGAIGLVSTHDLELGELEKECHGEVKNYHFREYYTGGEIKFDYRLRPGISTTRNAMYLIKMAGIEYDE